MGKSIDTKRINETVDITSLVSTKLKKVASTNDNEYAGPCPFCGGRDRFHVRQRDNKWFCRKCTGVRGHSVLDFIARQNNLDLKNGEDLRKACEIATNGNVPEIDNSWSPTKTSKPSLPPPPPPPPPTIEIGDDLPPAEWREAAELAIVKCEKHLADGRAWLLENPCQPDEEEKEYWSKAPPAARAYHWLQKRGIDDWCIKKFRLGFNPHWRSIFDDKKLAPGIVIPSFAGHENDLWYLKVRTSKSVRKYTKSKYLALRGSRLKTLFNANALLTASHGIIVESELDAMLLARLTQDMPNVAVASMGSAGNLPTARWRRYLTLLDSIHIHLDNDDSGSQYEPEWYELFGGTAKPLPDFDLTDDILSVAKSKKFKVINDVTKYWQCGGDVQAWLATTLMPDSPSDSEINEVEEETEPKLTSFEKMSEEEKRAFAKKYGATYG